jgi:hypothetical protein
MRSHSLYGTPHEKGPDLLVNFGFAVEHLRWYFGAMSPHLDK